VAEAGAVVINSQAPVGVITASIRGKVKLRIPAESCQLESFRTRVNRPKVLLMQTAQAIPCSR